MNLQYSYEDKEFSYNELPEDIRLQIPLKETYIPEIGAIVKYNPENKQTPYILKSKNTGKTTAVDDITLQNAIYQIYGVNKKTNKK